MSITGSGGAATKHAKARGGPSPRRCDLCGSDMWDNRHRKREGECSPTAPDFACKNRPECRGAIWLTPKQSVATSAGDQSSTIVGEKSAAPSTTRAAVAVGAAARRSVVAGAPSAQEAPVTGRDVAFPFSATDRTLLEELANRFETQAHAYERSNTLVLRALAPGLRDAAAQCDQWLTAGGLPECDPHPSSP